MSYELLMPSRIQYGAGSLTQVGVLAKLWGNKALIVSDLMMQKNGLVERCSQYLSEAGIEYVSYCGVNTEPTTQHVNEIVAICEAEGCDLFIALGGGSCIDAAKAAAVLMTNRGQLSDYTFTGGQLFQSEALPLIAIPTTAGTGSEVTKVTVIIDPDSQVKMMIAQPQLLPKAAIVDAELSMTCPSSVVASSGVDALCHAIEAYLSRKAQPATDVWALQAIERIYRHLPKVYHKQASTEDYEQVALGAMLAGAAFSNASVTLIHGMSRPIGALFHVPHGISNAMLLPAVLTFMASKTASKRLADIHTMLIQQERVVDVAGARAQAGGEQEDYASAIIHAVKLLCRSLGIGNLKDYGIDRELYRKAIPKMVSDAMDSGSPANCPFDVTREDIEQLYHVSFDYMYGDDLQEFII